MRLNVRARRRTSRLRYYLERHIELDGESHAGLARQLVTDVCHTIDDWDCATTTAIRALQARQLLWDGVLGEMKSRAA